jgi:pyruvate dehydrogenase E2 component (dihydrolipoamide acetyltransferase)
MEATGVKGETRIEEPTRAQRTVARRSAEARATVPDLELDVEVDVSALHGEITPALVRACALALREVPRANAAYRDGRFELYSRVNVAVALDAGEGYVNATVHDADRKSLAELRAELEAMAARAAAGELTTPELSGATFTLVNLGAQGISRATTVITPPQAAALSAGAARDVPVVRDGAIVPGRMMGLTLACDHRILYGAEAARFLVRVKELLEDSASL